MASFFIPAFLLLVLVLLLVLRPFIFSGKNEGTSRRQMNAAIYREELEKLAAERDAGAIDIQEYEMSHAEMRQRLFQDTNEEDDKAVMGSTKKVVISLCVFVVLISSGLYLFLGDVVRVAQNSEQRPMTQASVEKMVADFALKMEKDPDNLKGWAMLGRSYRILGRNEDAAKAYGRAGSFISNDPELLAEYADTLIATANGSFAGKPLQLINQSLKLDPNNLLALWLSGSASFSGGNYKAAVQTWQKLAKQLPPGSEEVRAIEGSIAEARSKGGLANTNDATNTAVASGKGVSGKIELSLELKAKVKSGDVVMVIARQPGERMPVAVLKVPVTQFPMNFALTDAQAMNPSAPISKLAEVSIEVRISKTGMAKAETGDLISAVQTVKVGSNQVKLLVDQVRQ
ncbi:c-type cytochrome biogenesis protein CcmI [Polynucleobacter wuianus]|uniref:C-type cytochrome biogenesis protein CcmI n=1 Tax=Polynucleobacter wuianus TaxID=1743168 RepID=A0A191UIG0_9BURK|nr:MULTISPECIES: c-type cytochrome biogenesis protein CcmI [Polynucleobacter]ANJ00789.1 c-type cytochrome biogenesis protein CcmI [Polynucleobacter wuianus]MBU3552889.1 c-type cytochrome biogenesis protein CcmI [Polynucleobacter sp. MWH-Post4-6-1]